MSTFSGRERGLAALTPDLVPAGRATDAAVRGMVAAVTVVAGMAASPGQAAREDFRRAVEIARAHPNSTYSKAFADTAWLEIDELREATREGS